MGRGAIENHTQRLAKGSSTGPLAALKGLWQSAFLRQGVFLGPGMAGAFRTPF